MRPLALLACLLATAHGQDVQLKVAKGAAVTDFLREVHAATGLSILYAPDEMEGKTVDGRFEFEMARDHAMDALAFVLTTCGMEVRRFGEADTSLIVVLPRTALTSRFQLTGGGAVDFDRSPASWANRGEAVGSLSQPSLEALLADLARGDASAALLLGYAAPRTPAVIDAMVAALGAGDSAVATRAAWALGRCGYDAKRALPALRESPIGKDPITQTAIERIEKSLHPALLDPARAKDTAPAEFVVRFETTKGRIDVQVTRAWAPVGADRFYSLVKIGFFDGLAFYRVIPGFVAQFGKHNDPRVNAAWHTATIQDDPVKESNELGMVTFAQAEALNSRANQMFFNLTKNDFLDAKRFAPIGKIVAGLDVAEKLYGGYRDSVDQGRVHFEGDKYLRENFPKLDRIKTARVVE